MIPSLVVTTTIQREPQPDPGSDAETLQALADLLLEEFPELNDARPDENIVEVFRRKLAHLKALSIL